MKTFIVYTDCVNLCAVQLHTLRNYSSGTADHWPVLSEGQQQQKQSSKPQQQQQLCPSKDRQHSSISVHQKQHSPGSNAIQTFLRFTANNIHTRTHTHTHTHHKFTTKSRNQLTTTGVYYAKTCGVNNFGNLWLTTPRVHSSFRGFRPVLCMFFCCWEFRD